MSQYVDGEEEQLRYTEQLVDNARAEYVKITRRPIPENMSHLLRWLARESFRLGYQHAHDRNTTIEDLWPKDEVTK